MYINIKAALELTSRREHLGKNMPTCPKCNAIQVQLIGYFIKPAEWKCRHCKLKFKYEPKEPNLCQD